MRRLKKLQVSPLVVHHWVEVYYLVNLILYVKEVMFHFIRDRKTLFQPYASKQSFNLPKTHTVTSGGITVITAITYTFDSMNRLTSVKEISSDGTIVVKRYYY